MRFIIAVLLTCGLCACEGTSASHEATASESAPLWGDFRAASEAARAITGDLDIERGGLLFTNGLALYTRTLNVRRGDDLVAREGDTFAAIALGPADLGVELRMVTSYVPGPNAEGLCGNEAPTFVAIAHDARARDVTLLVFAGEEPPSEDATGSRFCRALVYSAPDGARTRQGVLLQ